MRKQIAEALIGILGGAKARELPHGPQAAAVHRGVNAARVRRLAGIAKVAVGIPSRKISWRVQTLNGKAGNGGEFRLSLGILLKRGPQHIFFPGFFLRGRLAVQRCRLCGSCSLRRCLGRITHDQALPRPRRPLLSCYAKANGRASARAQVRGRFRYSRMKGVPIFGRYLL